MDKFVIYRRLSRDSKSGGNLGLEAQQSSVERFLKTKEHTILAEFDEVQTCNVKKNKERPKLREALQLCKEQKATLLVARLDRLHRNVAATSALLESGIDFICVDNPSITKFSLQILSCVAEKELEDISTRTSAALQAKKAQGFKLGKPENFTPEHRKAGTLVLNTKKKTVADTFALKMFPTLSYLRTAKSLNLQQTAQELTRMGFATASGSPKWDPVQVWRCLKRVKNITESACNAQF